MGAGYRTSPVGITVLSLTHRTALTPGAATTEMGRIAVPFPCRILRVDVTTISSASGASRPTLMVTDGTNNIFSGELDMVSAGVATATPTSTVYLLAARRNRTRGSLLVFNMTTVASEVVTGFNVQVTVAPTGQVGTKPDND